MIRRLLTILFLLALAPLPRLAAAACSFQNGTSWSQVIFAPPSQIVVPDNAAVGSVLWSSPMVSPTGSTDVRCTQYTTGGIVNYLGVQPASGATIFPTNVPGLSIRLARGDATSYLVASPGDYLPARSTISFSMDTSLQLIVTGTIPNGSTLYAGQLVHWDFGNLGSVQVFQTSNSVVFVRPACTVAVDPTVVTMEAITTNRLSGYGSTAGDTPFSIQLTCTSAASLQITLDTSNPVSVANGVLRAATGGGAASGVGVQITRNGNPVALRSPINVNATQGSVALPFAARYYRTGGTLQTGQVTATATYTLTYP